MPANFDLSLIKRFIDKDDVFLSVPKECEIPEGFTLPKADIKTIKGDAWPLLCFKGPRKDITTLFKIFL